MEAALLVPSGTMGNGLALLVHTEPGNTFLSHERGHVMGRAPFHTPPASSRALSPRSSE